MTWFPIGPDFVFAPRELVRARLSRRNELGRQGAVVSMSVGAPPTRSVYVVVAPPGPGALTGSAFRSDDGGLSWTPLTDEIQRTGTLSDQPVTIKAHPAIDGVVYLASASSQAKIFVSSDHGATWDSGHVFGTAFLATDIVVVPDGNPANQARLFATAIGDVVHSSDGGQTWQTVLSAQAGGRARLSASLWSATGPLYALLTTGGMPAGPAGVYYCDPSQPAVWTAMPGDMGLPSFINGTLDCCQNGRMYAYLINGGTTRAFVASAGPSGPVATVASSTLPPTNAGVPHWTLMCRVAPNSPGNGNDVVFVGTVGLHRTVNGGQSWQPDPIGFHADQHAMGFAPQSGSVPRTYLGCDGGVARSARIADPALATLAPPSNFGDVAAAPAPASQSWEWESLNHGIQSSAGGRLASPPGYPALSYLSCQDTSVAGGNGALTWHRIGALDGDGRAIAAAAGPAGVVLWLTNGAPFWVFRALDDRTFNTSGALAQITTSSGSEVLPVPDMTIDSHGYVVDAGGTCIAGVVTGASGRTMVVRIDGSGTATQIHGDLPAEPLLIALDPQSAGIYCTTAANQIFRTTDGSPGAPASAGWQQVAGAPGAITGIPSLTVTAQTSEAFAVVTTGGIGGSSALYKVASGAWTLQSWSPAPPQGVNPGNVKLVADPDSQNVLYLMWGRRVHRLTRTAANTWQVADLSAFGEHDMGGLPGGPLTDLWVGKASGRTLLRAAAPMRGAWETDASSPPPASALYMRNHVADLGWLKPGLEYAPNPYGSQAGALAHWQSPDIKVEARQGGAFYQTDPEYPAPTTTPIGHTAFDTLLDHSQAMTPNTPARVHLQVHNRSYDPAQSVSAWMLYCDASMGVPMLPGTFWSRFQANGTIDGSNPPNGPWFPVGPPKPVPGATVLQPQVVSWDWSAPQSIPGGSHYCLVAFVHGPAPHLITNQTTSLSVDTAALNNTQVGQRNVFWMTPGSPSPSGIFWTFLLPLAFHSPFEETEESRLAFDTRTLPRSARLRVRIPPATAELLEGAKISGGRRVSAKRGGLRDGGLLLQATRKGVLAVSGFQLPFDAAGQLELEVAFANRFPRGRAYRFDAVQQSRTSEREPITGGATVVFAHRHEIGRVS